VKIPVGVLYLAVSGYGIYWAHHMMTRRHTTSYVAYWYVDLLVGAIILGAGALLRWTRWQAQTRWLPVLGSAMVAIYYVGASVVTLRRFFAGKIHATGVQMSFALMPVLLVLVLFTVALFEKLRPELLEPLDPPSHSFN
jgi:surface polysaccharide O-acyltransferase-like enzyme